MKNFILFIKKYCVRKCRGWILFHSVQRTDCWHSWVNLLSGKEVLLIKRSDVQVPEGLFTWENSVALFIPLRCRIWVPTWELNKGIIILLEKSPKYLDIISLQKVSYGTGNTTHQRKCIWGRQKALLSTKATRHFCGNTFPYLRLFFHTEHSVPTLKKNPHSTEKLKQTPCAYLYAPTLPLF